jgi:16S rRNA (guanine527-N7)-methyltransferase
MGAPLASLSREQFAACLEGAALAPLLPATITALHAHYEELVRWSGTVSLVGPAFGEELFGRHYAESLAALPLLPANPCRLLDLGSGAGFPGLVLAAARPDCEVVLAEARERKWAFLRAATRRAELSSPCLRVTVGAAHQPALPDRVAVVTARALRISRPMLAALAPSLLDDALLILWTGGEAPEVPTGFRPIESRPLPGSERRFLRLYRRESAEEGR